MRSASWAVLGAVAVLWPSRLSGPLDGVPLDQPAEVIVVGLLLPLLLAASRNALIRPASRACIVALLAWKACSAATLTQDGWCVRFETPAPIYRDMGLVPHTWDVRADWRAPEPRCSAIVDHGYPGLARFPVWFYNLPPANNDVADDRHRPPNVTLKMSVSGALHVDRAGRLRIGFGDDMQSRILVDGRDRSVENDREAGVHAIAIESELRGDRWRFHPAWDEDELWHSAALATVATPSSLDRWFRPWASFLPLLLTAAVAGVFLLEAARTIGDLRTMLFALGGVATLAVGSLAGGTWTRGLPLLLLLAAAVRVPERLRNSLGFVALIAAPWLAFFAVRAAVEAGLITLYTAGDDWWMFQRFAYRIYMQGYWLEGGQVTFWFQPLYRWIAGALHLVFGDSSVGELIWDAWCVLAGSLFTFLVVKAVAGYRWAMTAAAVTLAVFALGPAWYLFGRGLSEISSAGLIYLAAILALRAQRGHALSAVIAGAAAMLAFYTRLNNLPMVLALVTFALPLTMPLADLWQPRKWWNAASRPIVLGIFGALAIGLWLFTWRTYYYTGVLSMLFGTQSSALGVWQQTTEGLTPLQNVTGSVLMVLTMNDPPRLDIRAIPIVVGVVAAVLGLLRVPVVRRLPLNAAALCLAGIAGALVARGTAYPGRFSVHLIPVTVALTFATAQMLIAARRERPNG
jgi:hypothetical protein